MSGTSKLEKAGAAIKPLESSNGWITWERKVKETIRINGFGDLLRKSPPTQKIDEATDDFEERKEEWEDRQEQMVAFIHSRLTFLPYKLVREEKAISQIMDKLEKAYKPVGSAVFQDLDRKYTTLTLGDCSSVADFAHKLRELHEELLQLDKSIQIGTPNLINKFLTGLGDDYRNFLSIFYQSNRLLPERSGDQVTKAAVTYEEAVMAAEQEELSQKQQTPSVALAGVRQRPYCQHCHKPGHIKDKCFHLHPELRAEVIERSKKRRLETSMQRTPTAGSSQQEENAALAFLQSIASTNNTPINKFLLAGIQLRHPQVVGVVTQRMNLSTAFILDSGAFNHVVCSKDYF